MRFQSSTAAFVAVVLSSVAVYAENTASQIKKAVERSTLDQPGTKPFHLKAMLAPSFERDKDAGLTGEVEIWWASPTRWRREVRSPEFHQIEVVDGAHDWQKNEGAYFPEWLRRTATELIKPVPPLEDVLNHAKSAEVHNFVNPVNRSMSQLSIEWVTNTGSACASFLKTVEPIPAIDTFVESDWRIKRDPVGGVQAVRVLAGYESPEGKLDPEQARGYWFDDSGLLLKTYLGGVETDWSDFKDFSGFKVARQIDVRKDGRLGMRIRVTEVAPGASLPASNFEVKGHEWQRAFTAEER